MTDDEKRAKRQAAREERWAEQEKRDADLIRLAGTFQRGQLAALELPAPLGPALLALFEAVTPHLMPDGYWSYPVVGRSSAEMQALAEAASAMATKEPA